MAEAENNMENLCDMVNKVLQSNQELMLRLRNMEDLYSGRVPAAQATPGAEQEVPEPTTDRPSSGSRPASFDSNAAKAPESSFDPFGNASYKASAFEEQLNRSRVYQRAAGKNIDSSTTDDGRSTLAFSICSSMTLGEVSKISVYALPVYATEISNAECYEFGRPSTPIQDSSSQSKSGVQQSSQKAQKNDSPLHPSWLRRKPVKGSQATTQEAPSRVFGVELQTSIRYANVAISLQNEEGESYIYGYIPIVVAKCGVFLKEKGEHPSGCHPHRTILAEKLDCN